MEERKLDKGNTSNMTEMSIIALKSREIGCVITHFSKGGPVLLPVGGFSRIECVFQSISGVYTVVFGHRKWSNSPRKFSPHLEVIKNEKLKRYIAYRRIP